VTRPLAAVPILAIVAIVGLFVVGMHLESPEPFALPPTIAFTTPVAYLGATKAVPLAVQVINWPTVAPAPTRSVWQTPTSAVPNCPGKDRELCQIPAPVLITPTVSVPSCNAQTIATFVPGDICRWEDATPIPTPGGLFR
jgi:hypothetical protein